MAGIVLLLTLVACTSSADEQALLPEQEALEIESFGVEYLFSDSARLTARLLATHVIEKIETFEVDPNDSQNKTYYESTGRTQTMRRIPPPANDSLKKAGEAEKEIREETVHYFDKGVIINFYNEQGELESKVISDNGIFRKDRSLAEMYGNVRVTNVKDEKLTTEQLFWDGKIDSIYTYKPVLIETPNEVIHGKNGMRANTSFTAYMIFSVRGEMEMGDELK